MDAPVEVAAEASPEEIIIHVSVTDWSGEEVARVEAPRTRPVRDCLSQIQMQTGVSPENIRLTGSGVDLDPSRSWDFLEMDDFSTVTMTIVHHHMTDRDVLVNIFDTCGGTSWQSALNWCSEKPLSLWQGIKSEIIDGDERVVHISLDKQLTGQFPESLCKLTKLRDLFFGDNALTGSLPAEFGNLSKLQYLNLTNNHLTGDIPVSITNLTSLQGMNISGNRLTGSRVFETYSREARDAFFAGVVAHHSLSLSHSQTTA